MYSIIIAIHVFVSILLILAVLLQSGKESDLGSAFGGGSSDSFGPATPANIMNKITTILVIVFFFTSITLTIMSKNRTGESILNNIPVNAPVEQKNNLPQVPLQSK
ncbi:preprotein translocase subunit G [Deferribacter desulfuricans SSM1]|uniref:Protein-export membrane protein SecG n=1 Tax=Deferribacter desulfuricans (strain DSM 14783 / JCM 11476 / NBRC 101012 / SSM1) TaxID=639282 RepID=D3PAL9_DEFDS|nr:preprotein translocase subunit SecG [Deferribacter desulfuricans]BAI79642.1 preprotein translocase subunit G [Deferribacter desulfuricans SSM1]